MVIGQQKTVLITGASEGIGRATAKAFAAKGANLILVARNRERLLGLAQELKNDSIKVDVHTADFQKESEVDNFFQNVGFYDIAINNAGFEGKIGEITELETSDYQEVFNVNVRAVLQCLKQEVKHFRSRKIKGSIVNVSSIAGFKGISHSSIYVASKHAVLGLTRAVAIEQIAHGIRVNCVSPGATDTAMLRRILGHQIDELIKRQPNGKLVQPEDIAKTILWLSNDDAEHVVGQDIVVDGGKTVMLP
jgi:NAD(P)-dependent dehydrogenase (short-subunit alcohol dehydrogenase family)